MFYLGKEIDSFTGEINADPLAIDPNIFVTHGVIFGATGSGKTGLSITLLESLAEAGIPIIIIDPKGDLPNLALMFPNPTAEDLISWVDPREASRRGKNLETLAAEMASEISSEQIKWGIDPERIQRLRERTDIRIYSPGSDSGIPVNVIGKFKRPNPKILSDEQSRQELIQGIVSGLLGLVGVKADPIKSPEHIVVSKMIEEAWLDNQDLDLKQLVVKLRRPSFEKIGILPIYEFFPQKKRHKLTALLNGLLVAPSFGLWMRGEPIDVDRMTKVKGKVPISIFYTAHLNDEERMFFTSILFEEIVAWSRTLPGTGSLRALVYFDEVMGYLPPYPKNPPSKKPILTLLKQARSVGVGLILSTQNPVDIDYKALSNAGTWFIGQLQTHQDRNRVLDGLLAASGGDRDGLMENINALEKRVFLLKTPRAETPILFHIRQTMSFLRGPLTRRELEQFDNKPCEEELLPCPPRHKRKKVG